MIEFDLPAGTQLKVTKTTPRKEHHGDDLKQAVSLRLEWTTANGALDKLHPQLRDTLFWDPPEVAAQLEIEGLKPVTKHRRCRALATPVKLDLADLTGYVLTIDHGIDDSSALELYACTLSKYQIEPVDGGAVIISWSLSSSTEITPELVGELCALEGCEITAALLAPVEAETIDGSNDAFLRDHPEAGQMDATGLFAGGADLLEDDGADDYRGRDEPSEQHAGDFGAGGFDLSQDADGYPAEMDNAPALDVGGEDDAPKPTRRSRRNATPSEAPE